jgi:sterol 14-demethylase
VSSSSGKAPPQFAAWPVVGALDFFSRRANFMRERRAASQSGNYSFYFGRHRIVGLSGDDGRRTFFDTKELSASAG